jgi:hypothetical protein
MIKHNITHPHIRSSDSGSTGSPDKTPGDSVFRASMA